MPTLTDVGIVSYPALSPMAARPDTTAILACQERGMPAVLAACADPAARLDAIVAEYSDGLELDHHTLSN